TACFLADLVEQFRRGFASSGFVVPQPLPDSVDCFQTIDQLQEAVVSFRVLHYQLRLALDSQYERSPRFSELFKVGGGLSLEIAHLFVFCLMLRNEWPPDVSDCDRPLHRSHEMGADQQVLPATDHFTSSGVA